MLVQLLLLMDYTIRVQNRKILLSIMKEHHKIQNEMILL